MLFHQPHINPFLPPSAAGPTIECGCGQHEPLRLLQADSDAAASIDPGPGQAVFARTAGVVCVHQREFRAVLAAYPAYNPEVTTTDPRPNKTKPEAAVTRFQHNGATAADQRPFLEIVVVPPNSVPIAREYRCVEVQHVQLDGPVASKQWPSHLGAALTEPIDFAHRRRRLDRAPSRTRC